MALQARHQGGGISLDGHVQFGALRPRTQARQGAKTAVSQRVNARQAVTSESRTARWISAAWTTPFSTSSSARRMAMSIPELTPAAVMMRRSRCSTTRFAVGSAPDFAIFSAPLDASSAPLALNDRPLWGGNTRILPVGAERVLYLTGEDHLDVEELYSARLDGVGPSVALAPPPPEGTPAGDVLSYQLTPDGSQALYTADRRGNGIYELFRRDAEGRGPAQRVHAPLVTGQELAGFRVTADSTRVVYRLHDGNYQLFSAPLDGSAAEVRLSPDLGGQHDVGETVLSHDSRWVVFSGNLDSNDSTEIYRVPVDGSAAPRRLSRATPASLGSPANCAALNAPTLAPTIMSGITPAALNAFSMPTWTAPKLPPPAITKAVLCGA